MTMADRENGLGHLNWEENGELETYFNPGLCDHPVQIKDVEEYRRRTKEILVRLYKVAGVPEIFQEKEEEK